MIASTSRPSSLSRRHLLAGGISTAVLSLLGCGGGGGGGGVAGVGTGGTGSFASGPIRGFGSIVVGGVHYDDAGAQIVGDAGAALARGDLRLGMVVEVNGSDIHAGDDGKRRATAASIGLRSEIEGPISAIDPAQGSFVVLGQRVRVTPATVFDDDLRGGLASLRVGQVVEVYGLLQSDGHYTATRIDDEDDARYYKLRGRVSALDAAARSLRIGDSLVSYADIAGAVAGLADGAYVRVELLTTPTASGAWRASRIQVFSAGVTPPADAGGVKVEIEGYITAFSSPTRFSVSGIAVDASGAAWLPAGLAAGVRVEVEGVLTGGVLQASEVEIEDDDDQDAFELEGAIASLDRVAQTLVVSGVMVAFGQARFKGGTVADLTPGARIEVEGHLAADGTTLVASEIEFEDSPDQRDSYEVEGRIASVSPAAGTFVVAGVTVDYTGARFVGGTVAQLAPGVKVEVEGRRLANGTLQAREIEFDD